MTARLVAVKPGTMAPEVGRSGHVFPLCQRRSPGPVPSINSSALKNLNISHNPGTLACHDDSPSIGSECHSITLQESPETSPRKSRPSATTRGLEPFGQKTATHLG
jgi:hypothetical protein